MPPPTDPCSEHSIAWTVRYRPPIRPESVFDREALNEGLFLGFVHLTVVNERERASGDRLAAWPLDRRSPTCKRLGGQPFCTEGVARGEGAFGGARARHR